MFSLRPLCFFSLDRYAEYLRKRMGVLIGLPKITSISVIMQSNHQSALLDRLHTAKIGFVGVLIRFLYSTKKRPAQIVSSSGLGNWLSRFL
ncbi:MAG: hypothetical protein RLY14_2705, partial [Planctomycetota bacterium]